MFGCVQRQGGEKQSVDYHYAASGLSGNPPNQPKLSLKQSVASQHRRILVRRDGLQMLQLFTTSSINQLISTTLITRQRTRNDTDHSSAGKKRVISVVSCPLTSDQCRADQLID